MADFWKVVRNLGALVGLIWACFQIYQIVFVDKYDLKAVADTNEFHIPERLGSMDLGYDGVFQKPDFVALLRLENLGSLWFNQSVITITNEGDNQIKEINLLTNGMNCYYEF